MTLVDSFLRKSAEKMPSMDRKRKEQHQAVKSLIPEQMNLKLQQQDDRRLLYHSTTNMVFATERLLFHSQY